LPDAAWKAFERRIAAFVGGKRRGADTRGERGGKTDIVHDSLAVEVKLLGRSAHADILNACRQAETNGEELQTPIAVVKRKGDQDVDAIVAMRLKTWLQWYGPTNRNGTGESDPGA
jgi:hypothetical protein